MKTLLLSILFNACWLGLTTYWIFNYQGDFILYLIENNVSEWLVFLAVVLPIPLAFMLLVMITLFLTTDTSRRMYEK